MNDVGGDREKIIIEVLCKNEGPKLFCWCIEDERGNLSTSSASKQEGGVLLICDASTKVEGS
jgi:hypothetical protein